VALTTGTDLAAPAPHENQCPDRRAQQQDRHDTDQDQGSRGQD